MCPVAGGFGSHCPNAWNTSDRWGLGLCSLLFILAVSNFTQLSETHTHKYKSKKRIKSKVLIKMPLRFCLSVSCLLLCFLSYPALL